MLTDELLSGKASLKLAELTGYAALTPCFHTNMTTYNPAVDAAAAAIRKMDTLKTSALTSAQVKTLALGLGGTVGDRTEFADGPDTVAFIQKTLGPPDSDSGWIPPQCGPIGDVKWRLVRWGDFELLLTNSPIPQPDGISGGAPTPHVAGWTYHNKQGPVSPILRTAEGVSLGSSKVNVQAAYPGELTNGSPTSFPGGSLDVFRGDFSNISFEFDAQDRVVVITSGQGGCGD